MGSLDMHRAPERIPEDVLRRAHRAGAKRLDWYAGRLDPDGRHSAAEGPDARNHARQVVKIMQAKRRQRRVDRRKTMVAKLVGLLRKPAPHRRPGDDAASESHAHANGDASGPRHARVRSSTPGSRCSQTPNAKDASTKSSTACT